MAEILKILVCDDDEGFLGIISVQIREAMERLQEKAAVMAYPAGEAIPAEMLQACDLAFLDIDFPRKSYNGMDIARTLRACNPDAVIIFVTNYVEYAPEGYEVQAFRYLLKSDIRTKLEGCVRPALERLRRRRMTYPIQISGETIHLPVKEILYLESQKHTVTAYVRRGGEIRSYSFYASLRSVETELESLDFLRIQKSYLVNMRHLKKFQCREAELSGGIRLPVSEKRYAEQKKKYLLWKGRQ